MSDLGDDLQELGDLSAGLVDPGAGRLYAEDVARETLAQGAIVFIAPSEDVARTLNEWGAPATTAGGGIGAWSADHAARFRGADVALMLNQADALRVASSLEGIARRVRAIAVPPAALNGGVNDYLAERGGIEVLYDLLQKPQGGFRSRFGAVLWRDLGRQAPTYDWLVKPWIARGEVAVVAGPSGSGKTFVVTDLAMAIVRGTKWIGEYRVKQGGVAYQSGEGQKGLLAKRIPAYRRKYGLSDADDLPIAFLPEELDLFHGDDHAKALVEEIKGLSALMKVPIELVVIDTLAAATAGADENSSKDVGPVIKRCNMIRQQTGATVVLVHHMNADGTKIRGWTGWQGNVDSVLICRKLDDMHDDQRRVLREVTLGKLKDGLDDMRVRFVLEQIEIDEDEDGDKVTSCVVIPPEGERKSEGRRKIKLLPREEELLRAIEWALGEHGITAGEAGLKLPVTTLVVRHAYVKGRFAEKTFEISPDETDEKARNNKIDQAIKRAGQQLLKLGLIDREGKFYWRTEKSLYEKTDAGSEKSDAKSDTASDREKPLGDKDLDDDDGGGGLW